MEHINNGVAGTQIQEYYDHKDDLIQDLTSLARQGNYVFRGYSKQDQLLPNLIRERDLSANEKIYLHEFEKYGSHYFVASNYLDFLSYAQHYGLPTRLLDFTYNPFVALSFALYAKKGVTYREPEDRDYYYILLCNKNVNILIRGLPTFLGMNFGHYEAESISQRCNDSICAFDQNMNDPNTLLFEQYLSALLLCDYQNNTSFDDYRQMMTQKIMNKRLCFIDTNQSNQRIIMQQGLFLLPYTIKPLELIAQIQNNSQVIKVNKSLRGELLEYLDTLGFNTFRLMPDLPNVCAAITQRVADRS